MAAGKITADTCDEIPPGRVTLRGLRIKEDCELMLGVIADLGEGCLSAELHIVCYLNNKVHASQHAMHSLTPFSSTLALASLEHETLAFGDLLHRTMVRVERSSIAAMEVAIEAVVAQNCTLLVHAIKQPGGEYLEFEMTFKDLQRIAWAPFEDFANWLERA